MAMPPEHRILIVDDEPSVRWLLAIAFDRQGIESDVAESGKEAVALLTRTRCRYCCVVLDLNIPPPDGIEVAKFIHQQCRDLPVVVVSGRSDLAERLRSAEFNSVVKRIVMKPVDPSSLVRYVHSEHCIREGAAENPQ